MGYNKVVINGATKIDLTKDTVSNKSILSGYTAHDSKGNSVTGAIPVRSGSAITKDSITGEITIPAGYYPDGMVFVKNQNGEWEWNPFNFDTGVTVL